MSEIIRKNWTYGKRRRKIPSTLERLAAHPLYPCTADANADANGWSRRLRRWRSRLHLGWARAWGKEDVETGTHCPSSTFHVQFFDWTKKGFSDIALLISAAWSTGYRAKVLSIFLRHRMLREPLGHMFESRESILWCIFSSVIDWGILTTQNDVSCKSRYYCKCRTFSTLCCH